MFLSFGWLEGDSSEKVRLATGRADISLHRGLGHTRVDRMGDMLDTRGGRERGTLWRAQVVSGPSQAQLMARKLTDVVHTIYEAVLHLPKPVRRVCIVGTAKISSLL